ncbi:MAG TPA: FGGY family carbohydrate kinase [Sumerlaeia bacterium]|nr:FGGY family carbohydrate kinase [Sumerlaeia bacterium]
MFLSIDLGSTHFKAAVFDEALSLRGKGVHRLEYCYASGGRVELAVEEVDGGLERAIKEAVEKSGVAPSEMRGVAVASQAQTFAVFGPDGRAKTRFISWQDTRARATSEELARRGEMADFAEHCSFGALIPGLQVCLIAHILRADPQLISERDSVLCLPTYLVRQLIGEARIDDNLAAMSGLFSLSRNDWWPEALSLCGLTRDRLPEVVPIGAVAGKTGEGAGRFGLPQGMPVILAGNDQTAGAYGAVIHEEDAVLITLGTAQVAYVSLSEMPAPSLDTIRGPYPGGRFYKMAADSCGGNVVNWACGLLTGCDDFDAFFSLAAQAPPGCDGLRFAAELPSGRGRWENIGLEHTAAHFARSVLESLVERIAALVQTLNADLRGRKVLAAGGGSRQAEWVRILGDRIGTNIATVDADPLLGAAQMARDGLGLGARRPLKR